MLILLIFMSCAGASVREGGGGREGEGGGESEIERGGEEDFNIRDLVGADVY